jgi:hypothetical protein
MSREMGERETGQALFPRVIGLCLPLVVVLQFIHGELADLAAVSAVVTTVLTEAHVLIGLAEDAVLLALALDFPHVAG